MNIFLMIFLIGLIVRIIIAFGIRLPKIRLRWFRRPSMNIFEHSYLESKSFYVYRFRNIPSTTYVDNIDIGKAFAHVNELYRHMIVTIHQSNHYNWHEKSQQFYKTLFVLNNRVIVELASDYAKILYAPSRFDFATKLLNEISGFKLPEKEKDYEINIITFDNNGLDLKTLAIKPTNLDLNLYYNDDFIEVDRIIRLRLSQQNDKGIVLLHGMPGTGKTTYLRHLIGGLNKKVLFVAPSVAQQLMNPEFVDLLIDNPNAILVIEDAENIMMDRKHNRDSSVSNLLNLSDGLLSDCLNVQIICTFNSALNMIDSALMRKGRLIARYEFGKLTVDKAQKLSDHLGLQQMIIKPMTLAEITNPDAREYDIERKEIGFRREMIEN